MFYVEEAVSGVAQLGNVVYVIVLTTAYYSIIKMYTADTLVPLGEGIHVEGMSYPSDIVACHRDHQLYIADFNYCIWRVSADDHSYMKWLPSDPLDTLDVYTFSLRSRHLLVTSDSRTVRQYSTSDRQLLRVVELPSYMGELHHAVETPRGTFVICHQDTSHNHEEQHAVSGLFF